MRRRWDGRIGRSITGLAVLVTVVLTGCQEGPATNGPGLFFPTSGDDQGGAMMTALFTGPLVVKNGCVLVGRPGEYSLPIWWNGFTAEPDATGRITVLDSEGMVVAVDGETFEMGGGYRAEFRPSDKVEPAEGQIRRVEQWLGYEIPDRCLTPDVYGIWLVGETEPLPTP
jgi:hypothetical protein